MTLLKVKNRNFDNSNVAGIFRPLFPEMFDTIFQTDLGGVATWMPPVNISETKDDFRIEMTTPGFQKSDVKVELENGVLTISGERKKESSEETAEYSRKEFSYGTFRRRFDLPEIANTENVVATMEHGILTLKISKKEETKLKASREIQIA